MVQLEVAERLAARPGSKAYGVPSVKAAWYAAVRLAGTVPRSVFWPVPERRVRAGLLERRRRPGRPRRRRRDTFTCIDAAFAQRRKTLRAALAGWAGSTAGRGGRARAAGIDPRTRGEQLGIHEFAAIASAHAGLSGRAGRVAAARSRRRARTCSRLVRLSDLLVCRRVPERLRHRSAGEPGSPRRRPRVGAETAPVAGPRSTAAGCPSPIHSWTPCSASHSGGRGDHRPGVTGDLARGGERPPNVSRRRPRRRTMPEVRDPAHRTSQAARSRTSTTAIGRVGVVGREHGAAGADRVGEPPRPPPGPPGRSRRGRR